MLFLFNLRAAFLLRSSLECGAPLWGIALAIYQKHYYSFEGQSVNNTGACPGQDPMFIGDIVGMVALLKVQGWRFSMT